MKYVYSIGFEFAYAFISFLFFLSLFLSGLDLVPFMVTFLVSFWQVQYGIVGGAAVSALMLLYIMARPKVKVSLKCWNSCIWYVNCEPQMKAFYSRNALSVWDLACAQVEITIKLTIYAKCIKAYTQKNQIRCNYINK